MIADVGLIGLGVMGKSLALNMAGKGYKLSLYNRPEEGIEENIALAFIDEHEILNEAQGFDQLKPFIESLASPRIVFLMITAGEVIDHVISSIDSQLSAGDIIIEGGNSHYLDSRRRYINLKEKGIHFIGTGISGGEEGALTGPSIMPGGSYEGFKIVEDFLSRIAAKDKNGNACMHYMGEGGAGHFVKTVHNGIEYAEMQLIAEVYTILKKGMGLNNAGVADVFATWLENGHRSYLLEITIKILNEKMGEEDLLNHIVDIARDKGTGSWSIQAASIFGVPVPTIIEALNARHISVLIDERKKANALYELTSPKIELGFETLSNAYMTARIITLHQGFHLIDEASKRYHWNMSLETVAQTWLSGCIIQSELMDKISHHLKQGNEILNAVEVIPQVHKLLPELADTVSQATKSLLYIPCLSASLNYFVGYTEINSSANLVQAQRDFFGAHKVLLKNESSKIPQHINWSK